MAQVLVFGTGGVGCTYAYFLSQSKALVTVVCRSNYKAIKENGIKIKSSLFGEVQARPNVVRNISDTSTTAWDYIMICTKAFPGTAELIKDAVSPSTAIILAQNGIGIEADYVRLYPDNPIISGVVYLPVTQTEPGVVSHSNIELLKIGAYSATSSSYARSRTEEFADLLRAADASVEVFDDIQSERWQKLLVNVSWNSVCALTRCSDTDFLRSTKNEAKDFIVAIMEEVASTAQADGYAEINDETIQFQIGRNLARLDGEGIQPSMLADVKNGRGLEVEAIVGNTVKIAKRLGVKTPKLDVIYILLRGLNASIVHQ